MEDLSLNVVAIVGYNKLIQDLTDKRDALIAQCQNGDSESTKIPASRAKAAASAAISRKTHNSWANLTPRQWRARVKKLVAARAKARAQRALARAS